MCILGTLVVANFTPSNELLFNSDGKQKSVGGGGLKAQVRNTCVQMQHITPLPPPRTW